MKVNFEDIKTATALSDISKSTFLFIGKEYPYAAARLYSYYVSKAVTKGVDFHTHAKGYLDDQSIHLFGTLEEDTSFILRKDDVCRIIPMKQGSLITKKEWGKYVSHIFVVEVSSINPSDMQDTLRSWLTLLEIPFKENHLKRAASVYESTYAGVLQCIEYSSLFGGLVEGDSVMEGYPTEVSYNSFKETFLYKGALDISTMVENLKDPMPYLTRLINDLAVLAALAAEREAGTSAGDIASSYGYNVFLLKNRVLPRLKTLGMPRILRVLGKLTDFQDRWLKGLLVSPREQLATVLLLEAH